MISWIDLEVLVDKVFVVCGYWFVGCIGCWFVELSEGLFNFVFGDFLGKIGM